MPLPCTQYFVLPIVGDNGYKGMLYHVLQEMVPACVYGTPGLHFQSTCKRRKIFNAVSRYWMNIMCYMYIAWFSLSESSFSCEPFFSFDLQTKNEINTHKPLYFV